MNARDRPRRAWVTLLTRSSYLPGVLLLHYSLLRVKSAYPLIVLVTPSLSVSSVAALRTLNIIVEEVQPLRPLVPVHIVAERFADTWDKLRAFGLDLERAVMVDGDMLLVQNMDDLFEMELPANGAGIAANHGTLVRVRLLSRHIISQTVPL
jgi:inositol 3-alpha-galactosyltransferase